MIHVIIKFKSMFHCTSFLTFFQQICLKRLSVIILSAKTNKIRKNKMSQNPQIQENSQPEDNKSKLKRKRKIRQAFKLGNFDQKTMLSTFKKYYNWKEKRSINIPFDELNSNEREPIFSIALHCGTKNGRNEVLNQYADSLAGRGKRDVKNVTMNSFQRLLSEQANSKAQDDTKRLTFVDFKTKRNQKTNFFSNPDVTSIRFSSKHESFRVNRVKTQPKAQTTYLRKTNFPKQLSNMKELIKNLPSVKQDQMTPTPSLFKTRQLNPTLANNSYLSFHSPSNQPWMLSQYQQYEAPPNERKMIFRKSKTQSIRGYIDQLNEVISYADELIQSESGLPQESDKVAFTQKARFTHKSISPEHTKNNRKYWPQYPRYVIKNKKTKDDQENAKFFSNFSYSDPKLNDELQSIVSAIKTDLNHQQEQMNKEIAQSQKHAIWHRYKYKMNIQRENYKRNVKSFLKCKKQYRIEKRREEVRANGIVRMKKSNPMDKVSKNTQKQEQES